MRALGVAVLLLLSGCSTSQTIDGKVLPFGIYSGTRRNVKVWGPVERNEDGSARIPHQQCERVVSIFDFPWSVVFDTILLPISVPVELLR